MFLHYALPKAFSYKEKVSPQVTDEVGSFGRQIAAPTIFRHSERSEESVLYARAANCRPYTKLPLSFLQQLPDDLQVFLIFYHLWAGFTQHRVYPLSRQQMLTPFLLLDRR